MKIEGVVEGDALVLTVRVSFFEILKGGGVMPLVEQLPISLPEKLPKRLKPGKPEKARKPKLPRKKRVVREEPDEEETEAEEEDEGEPEDDEEILVEKVVKASKINDELTKVEESLGILDERCKAAYSAIQAGKQERPEICRVAKIPFSSLSCVLVKLEQNHLIKKTGYGKYVAVSK